MSVPALNPARYRIPPRRGRRRGPVTALLIACLLLGGHAAPGHAAETCAGGPPPRDLGPDLRTPPNPDAPTQVRTSAYVEDLRDLDAVTASFRFRGIVTISWCDPRLAFDSAREGVPVKVFFGPDAAAEIQRIFTAQGFPVNQVDEPRATERVLSIRSDGTGRAPALPL